MNPNTLENYWMPFTANRDFKADPRMVVSAEGMHYTSEDGRQIMDGTAGLWCANAGHSHPLIVEAISSTAKTLDFAPMFNFGHPEAFRLAAQLAALFPDPLNRIFFSNSGSEAVDTALKISLAYHKARGKAGKIRFIGRERGYHGVGFGGISVGGIVANRKQFNTHLPGVDHMRHTHDPDRNSFTRGAVPHGAELADDLERLVGLHGAETIAAVIVEPVAGSTGVLPPPQGYLQRLREIATKHDILLIFDEVITGFGRLGKATASEYFGVTPDLITFAKGVTSGTIPMGGVAASQFIYDAVVENSETPIELFHGYTYSAHPIATAAALASLRAYTEEGMFENAANLEQAWGDAFHTLKDATNVIDIRTIGLVAGIELSSRDGAPGARAYEVMKRAWAKGLMVRVTGDIIALSPPLILSEADIGFMTDTLREVLAETA
ncbi:aspartate aminotransferase family protein [Paracoccus saliphilus]|uniref:Aspartate aminotransferase family protein n=1 Tax=Paracoccus saliphilus TaxID=405559 RepID=A0AA46A6Z2_9RHOB|nr:aspartate aminotransferase family protein [Paracoccus saliphilus]WCR03844.1 aspartate aminotransferase family protein [Paracoccus saliphilus]SIT05319.1 beta-alanine--pyruvate transaminase [Paracoccus saliphilus]